MRFLDSNIIAYAFYENEFQENCQEILRNGGIIDTLCLIEAFNIIEMQTSREVAIKSIKAILKTGIEIVNIDINIVFETLKSSLDYKKLKFLDLVHYMVATTKNCEAVVSYDSDFDKLGLPREEK